MDHGRYGKIKLSCLNAFYRGMYDAAPNLMQGLFGYVKQLTLSDFVPIMEAFGVLIDYASSEHLQSFPRPVQGSHDDDLIVELAERAFREENFLRFPDGALEHGKSLLEIAQADAEYETAAWQSYDDALKRYYEFVAYLSLQHAIGEDVLREHASRKRGLRKAVPPPRPRANHLRLVVNNG